MYQRENFPAPKMVQGRDVDWEEAMRTAKPMDEPEWVEASHPLYILYTSGTTGNQNNNIMFHTFFLYIKCRCTKRSG